MRRWNCRIWQVCGTSAGANSRSAPLPPPHFPLQGGNETDIRDTQTGSTGVATTYIGDTEWSATGLMGVAMAGDGAVAETRFGFARAVSRLREMQSERYLRL